MPYSILVLPLVMLVFGMGNPTPMAPEQAAKQFTLVHQYLEEGGTYYHSHVVAGQTKFVVDAIGEMETGDEVADELVANISAFLNDTGLTAMTSVGASAVPRVDGLTNTKVFWGVPKQSQSAPLWRAIYGQAPPKANYLRYLPAQTAAALQVNMDADSVWGIVKNLITLFGEDDSLEETLADWEDEELAPQRIFETLTGHIVMSLQLDSEAKFPVPMPGGMMPVPMPGGLFALGLDKRTAVEEVHTLLSDEGAPFTRSERQILGRSAIVYTPREATPIALLPTFVETDGTLLIATTPEIMKNALSSYDNGDGLATSSGFRAIYGDRLDRRRALGYVGKPATAVYNEAVKSLKSAPQAPMGGLLAALLQPQPERESGWILTAEKDGFLLSGVGSGILAPALTQQNGVMALPMLASIGVPRFVRARRYARVNSCINNLRMIDAAKEQWALENNKREGDIPKEEDIAPYIKGGTLPICPAGGNYTIGPIGIDPTCTQPRHRLP